MAMRACCFGESAAEIGIAGVVDQHVQAAESCDRLLDSGCNRTNIADICLNGDRISAIAFNIRNHHS